jgi:ubiquitin C-terminal hydrolase
MRGLWNLGNTCYFNTAVQCLAHVPPLTKHLFSLPPYTGPCDITREYQKIVRELFTKDKTDPVSPSDLLGAFRMRFPQFTAGQQHDAQEAILLLIDVFEQSLGKELVQDIFNGEDSQETLWNDGMSTVKSPFTTLVLDVSEPCRLQDLLDDRFEERNVEGYVDAQGKTHEVAGIRNRVSKWPRIVNFSFSMYEYKFPIEIPFEFEGRKLFACVLHQGVQRGGHYALLVRRFDKWYIKDDESVREIPDIKTFKGEWYQAWYRP